MKQSNNTIWVVEINRREVRHLGNGECLFSDESTKTRMFPDYEKAKETALYEWKVAMTDNEMTYERYKEGERETYSSIDIWLCEYELHPLTGEYLYKQMPAHLSSADYTDPTNPKFSRIPA